MSANIGALGNWLLSWVQEDGAINGFHNHSVWGSNPYRWADFTSGHSTWASLTIPALCLALKNRRDARLEDTVLRLLQFQTTRMMDDGQYAHIGFQMGETLKSGLIHNMLPNVALGLAAEYGENWLPAGTMERIRAAIVSTMNCCDVMYPFSSGSKISNQEYARLWAKLQYQKVFKEERWQPKLIEQLDCMIESFRIAGLPDALCEASYRYQGNASSTEPAEYYGLLIAPLVLAYEMFGHERYLQHAGGLCRHLARSSWYDGNGCRRIHRTWLFSGTQWKKINGPMLIAGMGTSLYGVLRYMQHRPDEELGRLLDDCDDTYERYQNPRGYFAAATGWQSEVDVVPSSAWHAHDLFYLLSRHGASGDIAEALFVPHAKMSVLLGDQCLWVEQGEHWAVTDYYWQQVFRLLGRKDAAVFGRDMDWVGGERALPAAYGFAGLPNFLKTDEGIFLMPGATGLNEMNITSIAGLPFLGEWR
ncbi:hypothetical protein [Paenibacillus contaminans]|uniref:Uncharacterized protein n=1 Tax=Paenibacillus contaminans TaxID=450362 RepID=A0A329MJG3_9BACL|nr:hypothetical protein [Paenibacillus contaminans]RAV20091.1 hypothetical protein DQG23_16605 [Paenibacillus contaminans]